MNKINVNICFAILVSLAMGFFAPIYGAQYLLFRDRMKQNEFSPSSKTEHPSHFKSVRRSRPVHITPEVASADHLVEGDILTLNFFQDKVYTARIDRINTNINGTITVRGRIENYPMGSLLISTTGNQSLASINIPEEGRQYCIQNDSLADTHYLFELNADGIDVLEDSPSLIAPISMLQPAEQTEISGDQTAYDLLDLTNIDVMIVYTPAAKSWAGGDNGIANVIAQAMAKAQLALDNSNVFITMTLVHSAEVAYTESGNSSTDLNRLTYTSDGYMDEVHTWRNTYKADLVALFAQVSDTGGVGWLLQSVSGSPANAFSLSRVQQVGWTYTMIHEMGHNMGCHHRIDQATQPGPGLFSYSAGWRWIGTDNGKYCSIMSYEEDGYSRVGYFSNPNVWYEQVPTGDAVNGDNARTLREIKEVIAAYRLSSGSLQVNISPQGAIDAGAQWRRVGTSVWYDSGYTENNVLPGDYSVEFKDIPGWIKPADIPVSVVNAQLAEITGVYTIPPEIIIGNDTLTWKYPLSTLYNYARTQTIYLASEIGAPCNLTGISLYVTTIPGENMNNFTIRLKHTDLSEYGTLPIWESSDWTTVYQENQTINETGWVRFIFLTPFMYNGTQNLMVDISFSNSAQSTDGYCRYSTPGGKRTLYCRTNTDYGEPLTWSERKPTPTVSTNVTNIKLSTVIIEQVAAPSFTPDGGLYDSPQQVTITCQTPNAAIHYTTNGHDPNENDPIIESGSSILVDTHLVLKAKAWKTDFISSQIKTAAYDIPVVICVSPAGHDQNDGRSWATAKQTLQAGLDAALVGDEIWVAAGTYNPSSDYGLGIGDGGKHFRLKNNVALYGGFNGTETSRRQRNWRVNKTVLSGMNSCYHIFYHPDGTNLNRTAILDGFVIRDGYAVNFEGDSGHGFGAGMANFNSSPTIRNCVFSHNYAYTYYLDPGSPGGWAPFGWGGGIYNNSSNPLIINCIFMNNETGIYGGGGGIFNTAGSPEIINCTFAGNPYSQIYNEYSGNPVIINCIVWGGDSQIYNFESTPVVNYSNIQGGYSGTGNIDSDPLFVSPAGGDLRLKSGSSCIDAGRNEATPAEITEDLAIEPRLFDGNCDSNTIVDMGAYEYYIIGDLNTNCSVNADDFSLFSQTWLRIDCRKPDNCNQSDIDRNGMVDTGDVILFAEHWLESN